VTKEPNVMQVGQICYWDRSYLHHRGDGETRRGARLLMPSGPHHWICDTISVAGSRNRHRIANCNLIAIKDPEDLALWQESFGEMSDIYRVV
jgi:hypothetical protein